MMQKKFSTLLWIGAGSASTPRNLTTDAEQSLLIEARTEACQFLQNKFSNDPTVIIQHSLVSVSGGHVDFAQYNLPEFASSRLATGLKQLFPGLQTIKQHSYESLAIDELLKTLLLTGDNNLLVLDVIDMNDLLLQAFITTHQLHRFHTIMLVTPTERLYQDSFNSGELTHLLEGHGFYQSAFDDSDPDLPWSTFTLNPLWGKFNDLSLLNLELLEQLRNKQAELDAHQAQANAQHAAHEAKHSELAEQLRNKQAELDAQQAQANAQHAAHEAKHSELAEQLRQQQQAYLEVQQAWEQSQQTQKELLEQISAAKVAAELELVNWTTSLSKKDAAFNALSEQLQAERVALDNVSQQYQQCKDELHQAKTACVNKEQELVKTHSELNLQCSKLKTELEQVTKHAAQRLDKIAALEKANRQLHETNEQLAKRQLLLEQEMLKAEAQIDIIKELILKP